MSNFKDRLERLKLDECAALGALKGCVAGMLIAQELGIEPSLKQWGKLRLAYDAAEAAAHDIMLHIMLPVGQD